MIKKNGVKEEIVEDPKRENRKYADEGRKYKNEMEHFDYYYV